ncbi:MAG: type II secretion system F family protein [Lachnospiraceae bacterium]|nr:type II secretion system F family protein [Lachnospiraceae bacterium]
MASYGYEAINKMGKEMKGSIDADSIEQAREKLKQQGFIVLSLKEESFLTKDINISFGKKVSARDMSVFCRQFVSMSRAGVSIMECLNLLREQTENEYLAKAIAQVHADVQKGESLAESMRKQDKIFSNLMVTTVAAGEESGSLDISLERMATQFERSAKTAALVKKAMIYPIVVAIMSVAIIVLMLVWVIPQYTEMFDSLGTELPGITKAVVAASNFLLAYWYIIIPVVIVIGLVIRWYLKTDAGKLFTSQMAIRIPMFRNLVVKSACSQMARTLSTLIAAGVSLVDAVEITSNTMQNVLFKDALLEARDEVIKGVPLSEPLQQSGLFPPMLYHMVRIGEESGSTEEMLTKLADYYDEEVEMATQSLMAAMEPMIIIVLAAIVCVILASIMAPMLSMYNALDNM